MRSIIEISLILATAISVFLAYYARRHKQLPGATPYSWLALCLSGWSFFVWLGLGTQSPDYLLLWNKISYFFILLVPFSVMVFSIMYRRQITQVSKVMLGLLLFEPFLINVLIWTTPLQQLFWQSVQIKQSFQIQVLTFVYGPAYWIHQLYSNLLLAYAAILLLTTIYQREYIQGRQIVAIGLGIVVPWTTNLLFSFGISPMRSVNLTPVLFAFLSPVAAWGLFHLRLIDIIPIANKFVITSMSDGIVILDGDHRIVALNPAAEKLTGIHKMDAVGKLFNDAIPTWLEFHPQFPLSEDLRQEISHSLNGENLFLDLTLSPLRNVRSAMDGSLLVIRDVTRHKISEMAHIRRNEEFSALHAILLDITAARSLPDLLETITTRATHLLNASGGSLYLADTDRREVKCVVSHNNTMDRVGDVYPYNLRVPGIVAQTGKPLGYRQGQTWMGPDDFAMNSRPTNSLLAVPLIWQSQPTGVIIVLDETGKRVFEDQDVELLTMLANQASIAVENARLLQSEREQHEHQAALALENARLFESAKRRAEEAETLRQATSVVAGALKQETIIDRILVELEKVVPYDSASVQLLKNGCLEIVGGRGWPQPDKIVGMRIKIPSDNPNTKVIEKREPYLLDAEHDHFASLDQVQHITIKSWLGVPLIVHNQVIGMLSVDSSNPNTYTADHARLVSAFADQVAIAIENGRLFAAERQRAEELDALWATIGDITTELELPKLLQSILERSVSLLNASGGELGLYVPSTNLVKIVACHQMGIDTVGIQMKYGEGAMGKVMETCQPVTVQDYDRWEGHSGQYPCNRWHSVLAVPMQIGGQLVGVLGIVGEEKDHTFSPSDQRLLSLFSQQAAIAVENAQLYQSARVAAERWAILHHASQEVVAASLDPEGIYAAIHHAAAQLMPSEAFAITLNEPSNQLINAVYIVDHMGRAPIVSFPANRGLSGHVIQTGKSLYIEDMLDKLDQVDSIRIGDKEEVRSILAVPMWLGGNVIGMLSTQSYQPRAYTPEDQYLLEMLASYAAIALDNTRLFQEVQKLAITDALTGIFNRRQLFDLGQREYNRSIRFSRPLSAIMIDIDRFKSVNDTYGHHTGDQVLQLLTKTIQGLIREIDVFGRYGGEEFVILLPETNCAAAIQVAERIRKMVNTTPFATDEAAVQVTISLGVAEQTEEILDFANLVARADAALYDAKHGGRNRVGIR